MPPAKSAETDSRLLQLFLQRQHPDRNERQQGRYPKLQRQSAKEISEIEKLRKRISEMKERLY
jgi:hypothetical protein